MNSFLKNRIHRSGFKHPASILALGTLLFLPHLLFGQFTFQQRSEPPGLFSSSSQIFDTNSSLITRSISTNSGNFIFTHWTINGVRKSDPNGLALHSCRFNITSNTIAIAHYFDKHADSDADGVPDWVEIKNTGNLNATANSDSDGDGIPLGYEAHLGLNPSIDDNITEGGISIRRSSMFAVNFGGAKKLTLKSDPIGLVSSQVTLLENNSTYQSTTLSGKSHGYYFSHWEVNGVRQSDVKGVGLARVSQTMSGDKQIVAKYYAEDLDSDQDGIPDWYEWHYLGNLNLSESSDPDGDGFSLAEERKLGLSSVIDDNITEGGVSQRRSRITVINLGGASKLTIQSDPPGLVASSLSYPEINSTYSSPSLYGLQNGFYFSHWEVNGVRQSDSLGIGLSKVTKVLDGNKEFVAKFYSESEDSDGDGIPDWYERREFGNLDQNQSSDPDGDGFSVSEERKLGLSSVIFDTIKEGSISMRRSRTQSFLRDSHDPTDSDGDGLTNYQEIQLGTNPQNSDSDGDGFSDHAETLDGTDPLLASSFRNVAPNRIFSPAPLRISENQPVGTLVGNILGADPNDSNFSGAYSYSLVDGNGSTDNVRFQLDSNGTLTTAETFDYEALLETADANLSIRIRISDSENLFFEDSLTVLVTDVFEDLDQDGIEDHLDPDQDGDGFSNQFELEQSTDPRNSHSIPNRPPSSLTLLPYPFLENLPPGSVIADFNATDPDANTTLTLSLVDGNGSKDNALFSMDANGSLLTQFIFDFETNATHYSVRVRVRDESNASLERSFLLDLLNQVEDLDRDGIEDYFDLDDDGDGFTDLFESEWGTDPFNPTSTPNQAPSSLSFSTRSFPENLPVGSIIGKFAASDPDANATLTLSLANGRGSEHNALFGIDANGSLVTRFPFDFETNASNYSIRVQVRDEWNASLEESFQLILDDLDENPPVLTLIGPTEITLTTGIGFRDPGATWIDDLEGNGTTYASRSDFNVSKAGTYTLLYTFSDRAGNPAKDLNRTLIVRDPALPLVRTLTAQLDGNDSVSLHAELLDSGGLEIAEIGVEIGTRPSLSDGRLHPLRPEAESGFYSTIVPNLPTGVELFYRAYAINRMGIAHGSVHKIQLPQEVDPNIWWTQALVHDGGWRTLDWFGTFLLSDEDYWVYHAQLGWIYLVSDDSGGIWMWKQGLDWVWTSRASAPFYWMNSTSNWLYPLHLERDRNIFWDYARQQAIRLP